MKVLVCGSSKMRQREWIFRNLTELAASLSKPILLLIQGGAPGVDTFSREWAEENGIQPCTYHALWKFHGTPAGPIRNRNQLLFSQPDLGIAFPGSRGTYNMWALLREHAVPRIRIDNDGNAVWYTGRADVAEASALAQGTICGHETV